MTANQLLTTCTNWWSFPYKKYSVVIIENVSRAVSEVVKFYTASNENPRPDQSQLPCILSFHRALITDIINIERCGFIPESAILELRCDSSSDGRVNPESGDLETATLDSRCKRFPVKTKIYWSASNWSVRLIGQYLLFGRREKYICKLFKKQNCLNGRRCKSLLHRAKHDQVEWRNKFFY